MLLRKKGLKFVILYIEDVDLNATAVFPTLPEAPVILYIEDVDLNSMCTNRKSAWSCVILYIEDVDLNRSDDESDSTQWRHPLHWGCGFKLPGSGCSAMPSHVILYIEDVDLNIP